MKINIKKTNKRLKTQNSYLIHVPSVVEGKRGSTSFCEIKKQIPFHIKRVYWIYKVSPEKVRGEHAHKKTEQVLFCLQGSINMELDDGKYKDSITLDNPNIGIFLGKMLWHKMSKFKKNTVLLILASRFYDEKDCIRDYNNFKHFLYNDFI